MLAVMHAMAEIHPGAMEISTPEGETLFRNAAWQSLFGSRSWRDLAPDLHGLGSHDITISATGTIDVMRMHMGDEDRWWTAQQLPITASDGTCFHVVVIEPSDDRNTAQAQVWSSVQMLQQAEEVAHVGAWSWAPQTGMLLWSQETYRIFGYEPDSFTPTFQQFLTHVFEQDRAELQRRIDAALTGSDVYDVRHRIRRADDSLAYVRERGKAFRDAEGQVIRMMGTVQNVTEEVQLAISAERAYQALAESEHRYRLLAELTTDVVWEQDPDGTITWISESSLTTLGWPATTLLGTRISTLIHADDLAQYQQMLLSGPSRETGSAQLRLRTIEGEYRWMRISLQHDLHEDSSRVVGSLRDINEIVDVQQKLAAGLGRDSLTGLMDLNRFIDIVDAAVVQAERQSTHVAVLCVGVGHLSRINAAISHAAGDHVLTTLASRIVTAVNNPDSVARGAGNEIFVLLNDLDFGADAVVTAQRIRRKCSDSIKLGRQSVLPNLHTGIAISESQSHGNQLVRDAAAAMQKAKLDPSKTYEFALPTDTEQALHRLSTEHALFEALHRNEFLPYYQPIVDLADQRVRGFEALIRWKTAEGNVVSAGDFISLAERSNLIHQLDVFMFAQVCADMQKLPSSCYMAINVSTATLTRADFADAMIALISAHGLDPSRVHLEITETSLLDVNPQVTSNMSRLAGFGVRWYVDDFGTGYSSISHLRDLPIDGLKLDRSFTVGVAAGEVTAVQLSQALSGLASALGLDTVAEGIETEQEATILMSQDWRHGQGWLFGKAMPLEQAQVLAEQTGP